jgi:hypothetical protein
MSTMKDALRLIIERSPAAAPLAMDCIRAIDASSPAVSRRYDMCVSVALADRNAGEFDVSERALLAQFAGGQTDTRSIVQPVRLSPDERQQLEDDAGHAGLSLSDYIRQRLFGG